MIKRTGTILLSAFLVALLACAARADVFHMRDGSTVEGELIQHKGAEIVVKVGSGTLNLPADQVEKIEPAPPPLEQYRQRLAALPETAEAHVELARWCAAKWLNWEARDQYTAAIRLDPDNAAARAALGFLRRGGQWLTRDEARDYDAVVRQQHELAQRTSGVRDANYYYRRTQWKNKLQDLDRQALGGWLLSDEAQAAYKEIGTIRDFAAVEPLVEVLGRQENAGKRLMAAEALANIGGDDAAMALVGFLTHDNDRHVLAMARQGLVAIGSAKALQALNNLVRGDDVQARDRVAPVLADLGSDVAVLNMINSLVIEETYVIHHAPTETQRAWFVTGTQQAYVANLVPVVANAAVGYRAVIGYVNSGAVLDVRAMVEPWDEHITRVTYHPDILDALRRLTGQDFGYDLRAWRLWYATQQSARKAAEATPQPAAE